jgi:hypothetical protein
VGRSLSPDAKSEFAPECANPGDAISPIPSSPVRLRHLNSLAEKNSLAEENSVVIVLHLKEEYLHSISTLTLKKRQLSRSQLSGDLHRDSLKNFLRACGFAARSQKVLGFNFVRSIGHILPRRNLKL